MIRSMKVCSIQGCEVQAKSKSPLCSSHNRRQAKYGDPTAGPPIRRHPPRGLSPIKAFQRLAPTGPPDECWEWPATRTSSGYGQIYAEGKFHGAHRLALEAFTGEPVPRSADALHSCDNPPCVNPAHLRVGTNLTNIRDKTSRNRCAESRISRDTLRSVRESHSRGQGVRDIAKSLNVSTRIVERIIRGETWSRVA